VGEENGLAGASVVSCDNVTTVPADSLGTQIGVLLDHQEALLTAAIQAAFDLD
jgi:mRNA interferase MazF